VGARFRLDGLAELVDGLQQLTPELTTEAGQIIRDTGDAAANEILLAYPSRTGNLRKGVKVTRMAGQFSMTVIVKNTAKLASIFEDGSQARHTELGANRGSMPPGHVFVPIMMRRRRAMYAQLKALIASTGLTVSGDA
jgi:hypothetical protein